MELKRLLLFEKNMSNQKIRFVLARYLPPKAFGYCVRIWKKTFDLTVTPKRSNKLDDYSYDVKTTWHRMKARIFNLDEANAQCYSISRTYELSIKEVFKAQSIVLHRHRLTLKR
jgi:hypothetical protein